MTQAIAIPYKETAGSRYRPVIERDRHRQSDCIFQQKGRKSPRKRHDKPSGRNPKRPTREQHNSQNDAPLLMPARPRPRH